MHTAATPVQFLWLIPVLPALGVLFNTFVGPRFVMRGPTGPTWRTPLAGDAKTARALWTLSEQLTGTEFPL